MNHGIRAAIVVFGISAVAAGAKPGRIKFNEITITKAVDKSSPLLSMELLLPPTLNSRRPNCVIAGASRRAGVSLVQVFCGSLGPEDYRALSAAGAGRKASPGTLNLELFEPPSAKASKHNRQRELGAGGLRFDELRVTLLQPGAAGNLKEFKTVRLLGARLVATAKTASGGPPAQGAATLSYTGLEPAPAITGAGGGVWKTINK